MSSLVVFFFPEVLRRLNSGLFFDQVLVNDYGSDGSLIYQHGRGNRNKGRSFWSLRLRRRGGCRRVWGRETRDEFSFFFEFSDLLDHFFHFSSFSGQRMHWKGERGVRLRHIIRSNRSTAFQQENNKSRFHSNFNVFSPEHLFYVKYLIFAH